jgi:hypothetical protein
VKDPSSAKRDSLLLQRLDVVFSFVTGRKWFFLGILLERKQGLQMPFENLLVGIQEPRLERRIIGAGVSQLLLSLATDVETPFLSESVWGKKDLSQKIERVTGKERSSLHLGDEPMEKAFPSPQLISLT